MPSRTRSSHAYKEITLQQLRSFVETARRGSLAAAAAALGLTHPTVWAQVHALEKVLGTRLVRAGVRGTTLTVAGRDLLPLVEPLVNGAARLRERFAATTRTAKLTVAATPRVMTDDLPGVIRRFTAADLTLVEMTGPDAFAAVAAGRADAALAFRPHPPVPDQPLEFRPAYELATLLICPLRHRLARRKSLALADLAGEVLVNDPASFPDPLLPARLADLGLFGPARLRVSAQFASTCRAYVRGGFGLAITFANRAAPPDPTVVERDLSDVFGRATISLAARPGAFDRPELAAFEAAVHAELAAPPATAGGS